MLKQEYEHISIDDVIPYENNPRHNEPAVDAVKASIDEFGFTSPIIVDENMVVLAGHTRLKAAKALGLSKVPVVHKLGLTPQQKTAYRIADNKTAELAEWDFDKLEEELAKIDEIDMSEFGFGDLTESLNINEIAEEIEEQDVNEKVPERVKSNQLWKLGDHVLYCADATDPSSVQKAVETIGDSVQLLLTDPPYNVAYEGCTSDKLTIQNDKMSSDDFKIFLTKAFSAAHSVMDKGACYYIWYAATSSLEFITSVLDSQFKISQHLIWSKNMAPLGMSDYQNKYEPCIYGWKLGAAHKWYSDRKQTSVLEFDKPLRNAEHPTMKPISLFAYLINNSSKKGDIVLDLFAGSGTTIIACEQLNRKAVCLEIDPHYCDVIINRWEEFTGKQAELLEE